MKVQEQREAGEGWGGNYRNKELKEYEYEERCVRINSTKNSHRLVHVGQL